MAIYRSNDPTTFDDVDGIVIDETAPPPNIRGVSSNVALLVGQFERGPGASVQEPGSTGNFNQLYGLGLTSGRKAAINKRWGRLKIVRVTAAAAVKATLQVDTKVTFTAKYTGAYGNNITVTTEAVTGGTKYTIADTNANATIPAETYVSAIGDITASTFAGSRLVDVVVDDAGSGEPAAAGPTNLATGADGTVADTDYETALLAASSEGEANFVFLDSYNSIRNGYLETHAGDTQDRMVVLAGPASQTVAAAVTDVGNYRDTDGRIIYTYPYLQYSFAGAAEFLPAAAQVASVLSQTSPHLDPAFAGNAGFSTGVEALEAQLTRADYITLKDAGIAAWENDKDVGFKLKSGIVTQILNSSKVMIFRRRMADYLTNSAARFLKNYQNNVNSKQNRQEVAGAFYEFIGSQERLGILPGDTEVNGGAAKLVDTESLNTDADIAAGFFKILWRQRIWSSMRFIVLQAEIGESVVVTEA